MVLNGRSQGDSDGNFTYLSKQGASVCDLVCVTLGAIHCVESFRVCSETFSDHLPLAFSVCTEAAGRLEELLPRCRWAASFSDRYNEGFKEWARGLKQSNEDAETLVDLIISGIRKLAAPAVLSGKYRPRQLWYDQECERLRTRSMNLFRLFRATNAQEVRN